MKTQDQLELEFYKNGSAKKVLERYEFSTEEKKLIQDAIRTAAKEKPRMLMIRKADKLLRDVAKTRKPISPKKDIKLDSEAIAMFDKYIHEQAKSNTNSSFLDFQRKSSLLLLAIATATFVFSYLRI